MKRKLFVTTILVAVLMLAGGLSACSSVNGEAIAGSGQAVNVSVNDTFDITLDSNPTTGYSWQAEYDEAYLVLVDRTFKPSSDAVGAGGVEVFTFRALKDGETKVTMVYKRAWEATSLKSQVFEVKIGESRTGNFSLR